MGPSPAILLPHSCDRRNGLEIFRFATESCADSNDRKHPPRESVLCPIRKITVSPAIGAVSDDRNRILPQSGVEQLTPVGLHKIEMYPPSYAAMTRGAACEKKQR